MLESQPIWLQIFIYLFFFSVLDIRFWSFSIFFVECWFFFLFFFFYYYMFIWKWEKKKFEPMIFILLGVNPTDWITRIVSFKVGLNFNGNRPNFINACRMTIFFFLPFLFVSHLNKSSYLWTWYCVWKQTQIQHEKQIATPPNDWLTNAMESIIHCITIVRANTPL